MERESLAFVRSAPVEAVAAVPARSEFACDTVELAGGNGELSIAEALRERLADVVDGVTAEIGAGLRDDALPFRARRRVVLVHDGFVLHGIRCVVAGCAAARIRFRVLSGVIRHEATLP